MLILWHWRRCSLPGEFHHVITRYITRISSKSPLQKLLPPPNRCCRFTNQNPKCLATYADLICRGSSCFRIPDAESVPSKRAHGSMRKLSITPRGDPQQPDKRASHHIHVAESGVGSHLLAAVTRAFKLPAGGFDAHLKHVLGWRRADLSNEYALEVSHAHRHPIGEVIHGQFALEVLGNPDLQLTDRGHLRGLRCERNAHLRLPTRPPEKQHQFPCRFVRQSGAAIFFSPGESEVDARREPSRGINVAVFHPDRIAFDTNLWMSSREFLGELPVCRGPSPVQQPGFGEQESGRADGAHSPHLDRHLPEPRKQRRVTHRTSADPAHQQHRIANTFHLIEVMPGEKFQNSAFTFDGQMIGVCNDLYCVDGLARKTIDRVEDLERTNQIELVDRRHHNDDDSPGRFFGCGRALLTMPTHQKASQAGTSAMSDLGGIVAEFDEAS